MNSSRSKNSSMTQNTTKSCSSNKMLMNTRNSSNCSNSIKVLMRNLMGNLMRHSIGRCLLLVHGKKMKSW